MAVNPKTMMQMASRLRVFTEQHPKVVPFFETAGKNAVQEGTIVEMKITSPEGREYVTNIRLTKDDLETLEMLQKK